MTLMRRKAVECIEKGIAKARELGFNVTIIGRGAARSDGGGAMRKTMASFGLTLANRGAIIGVVKVSDLIELAVEAEASGAFDAVWVGDSLLAKPRLESVTLLGALAGATRRVRLGVGCLATFVHRHPVLFAHQWASLDVISHGRTWLVVCLGGPNEQSAAQALEHAVMGIRSHERGGRLEEGIEILRKLFHGRNVSHYGRFYQFEGVTLEPSPVQNPCPIWIASNPTGLTWKGGACAAEALVERNFRRVARLAAGWMTNKVTPDQFRQQWARITAIAREAGRDPARLGWTAAGSPRQCIDQLSAYFEAGLQHIALRLTSWDQRGQLKRFLTEVAPAFSPGHERHGAEAPTTR